MNSTYLNNFESKEQVFSLFGDKVQKYDYVDVLLASYDCYDYYGDAFVLYRDTRDMQLYEVNASHCSCYGLEGQWEPEKTDIESLEYRLKNGLGKRGNFNTELTQILKNSSIIFKYLS